MAIRSKQNRRDLLKELIKTNFKLRYNNSILGFVWVLMKPFLSFLIMYVVFTAFRGKDTGPNYGPNLLLGMIMYYYFQEGVLLGMKSLLDNAHIILKIDFPRDLAVISSLFIAVINFLINLLIITVIMFVFGFMPDLVGLAYFFAIILILSLSIYAITLFLSILMIKIRDLEQVMELALQLLFWSSAVMYSINDIKGRFGSIIRLNPIAVMIDGARNAIVNGVFLYLDKILLIGILALVGTLLGRLFFKKYIRQIAEYF